MRIFKRRISQAIAVILSCCGYLAAGYSAVLQEPDIPDLCAPNVQAFADIDKDPMTGKLVFRSGGRFYCTPIQEEWSPCCFRAISKITSHNFPASFYNSVYPVIECSTNSEGVFQWVDSYEETPNSGSEYRLTVATDQINCAKKDVREWMGNNTAFYEEP